MVGVVEEPQMTYNVQCSLHEEGYYNVKAIPLGANLCLLEGKEEGVLEFLLKKEKGWVGKWFSEVHRWSLRDVDNKRLTWVRCYGIPCHVWFPEFFSFLVSLVGVFLFTDDETKAQSKFDVATIMVRIKYNLVLNEYFNIGVNGEAYSIKIVEDANGPKRIVFP